MIAARIREIVKAALDNDLDPVTAVMEYFEEKDSRITRWEAEQFVIRFYPNDEADGEHSGAM